jgi:hypothetical protein
VFLPHPPAAKTFIFIFNFKLLLCSSHSNFVLLPQALSCDHGVPFAIYHSRRLNAKEEEISLPTKSTRTSSGSKRGPPEVSLSCLVNKSRGANGLPASICAARSADRAPSPLSERLSFLGDTRCHLRAADVTDDNEFFSPYISLTSSLLVRVTWAPRRKLRGEHDLQISIIDTKAASSAIIPASVLVDVTNKCKPRDGLRSNSYEDEYLAYDVLLLTIFELVYILQLRELLNDTNFMEYVPLLKSMKKFDPWHDKLRAVREETYKSRCVLDAEALRTVVKVTDGIPTGFRVAIVVQLLSMRGSQAIDDQRVQAKIVSEVDALTVGEYADIMEMPTGVAVMDQAGQSLSTAAEMQEMDAVIGWILIRLDQQQHERSTGLSEMQEALEHACVQLERSLSRLSAKVWNSFRTKMTHVEESAIQFEKIPYRISMASTDKDGAITETADGVWEFSLEIQTAVEKATEEHANTLKRKRGEARANDQDKENLLKCPKLTMDDYRKLRGAVKKAARLSENGIADANTIS